MIRRLARLVALMLLIVTASPAADGLLSVPFFKQRKNGCGAASVAMVMRYWGAGPSADEVYQSLYDPARKAIPLARMKQYLEQHQFHAFTLRGAAEDVESHLAKGRPVIAALRPRPKAALHFVVITGMAAETVWINDPTRKKPLRMKRADFEKQWALGDRWMLLAASGATNPKQ